MVHRNVRGFVGVAVFLGGCLLIGCGSGSGGAEDVDVMFDNLVVDVSDEANTVAQEYQLAEPAEESILDQLKTCLETGRACKKECHEVHNDMEPFHSAIKQCKDAYVACRKDEANDPKTCRETAKTCVKTAIETLKPFVECMKKCIGEFKTCIGGIERAEDTAENEGENGEDPRPQPGVDPRPQPGDQPRPCEAAREMEKCILASRDCQKSCMQDLGAVLGACREGFETCMKPENADHMACRTAFGECTQAAMQTLPTTSQECLTKCGEEFKVCVDALKP